jgi:succinoglycan biosynthesis protein ExoO
LWSLPPEFQLLSIAVSVVVPAFNAAGFLIEAIKSLQAQTLENWEAIIVDDASTDETLAVAEALARSDPRIRVIPLPHNCGPGVARNAGLAAATGEWIGVLDADDVYLPERLEKLLSAAQALDADLIADNQWFRDPAHGRITRSGLPRSRGLRRFGLTTIYLQGCGASGFDYGNLKPLVRRNFLESAQVSYPPFRYAEDFAFLAELLASGAKAWLVHHPYYIYTLSVSEVDGRRSSRSNTDVDLNCIRQTNSYVLKKYGARLSRREKAAIRRLEYYDSSYAEARAFKEKMWTKDYVAMFGVVLRRPFVLYLILRGMRWRLRALLPDQRYFGS